MFGPAYIPANQAAACMNHLYFLNSLSSLVNNFRAFDPKGTFFPTLPHHLLPQIDFSAPCSPTSDSAMSPAGHSFCTGSSPSPGSEGPSPAPSCGDSVENFSHFMRPVMSRPLPFSIDNILKPEFGNPAPVGNPGKRKYVSDPSETTSRTSAPYTRSPLESLFRTAQLPSFVTSSPFVKIADDILASDVDPKNDNFTDDETTNDGCDQSQSSEPPVKKLKEDFEEKSSEDKNELEGFKNGLPAWVFCTRYSDRPSSGPRRVRVNKKQNVDDITGSLDDPHQSSPRSRRVKRSKSKEDKRPRTAFSSEQLARLKAEFDANRYLNEKRRQDLAQELQLNEAQIKIWFQNKRAKLKKATGQRGALALQLMSQGLYDHSTIPVDEDENEESILAKYANHAKLQQSSQ